MATTTESCAPPAGTADGTWHWIEGPLGAPVVAFWYSAGSWILHDVARSPQTLIGWRYIAPCATPDEIAALRAERDALRKALERIVAEGPPAQYERIAREALVHA